MPAERLQKILAAAGIASRRASEALITEGRVRVDGRVARLGEAADPELNRIEVDGAAIGVGAARAYLALHKPAGVTSTVRDRHAAMTVLDLLPTALVPDGTRVYPVGRLDLDSEGLLLLTNDGAWADHVLHPRFEVEREYGVGLARPLTADQVTALERGVELDEGPARLVGRLRPMARADVGRLAAILDPVPDELAWYRATLRQGWKRQLRRMFGAVGAPIARLVRIRIGAVELDELPSGRVRRLRAPEIRALAGEPADSRRTKPPAARYPRRDGRARPGGGGRRAP